MRVKLYLLLSLLVASSILKGQETLPITKQINKGKVYILWGWNQDWYAPSSIHFTGTDYDFILTDVKAHDKQSDFNSQTYFHPKYITYPQTNLRLGYYISDKYDVSIGVDHMKYVISSVQDVRIRGHIRDESIYAGEYINSPFHINENFLRYEHTDGLNYINIELTRNDNLLHQFASINPGKFQLNSMLGFGLGPVLPKSNVTLWNNVRNDEFHFAGYGFSGKAGFNAIFYKYFFLRTEFKAGFIDLPDVRTSIDIEDRASQNILFVEWYFAFGMMFQLTK
ncbi:MAG: hypothetical protein VR77_06555 [Flavobacteriales bacterium BRH_c54]|nr:MAG: hypothetical protein VR77_06555 [Flavobacteriales bacterium BRH_c54]